MVFFRREHLKRCSQVMQRQWHVIDARDQIVGRLANYITPLLVGKHRPDYSKATDKGPRARSLQHAISKG